MEMDDLTGRLPFGQHLKNIKKVAGLVHRLDRGQFPLSVAAALLAAAEGYLALVLSAMVLNRVEQGVPWGEMAGLAGILLTVALLCRIALGSIRSDLEIRRNAIYSRFDMQQSRKLMEMDFSMIDSPLLEKIKSRIYKDNCWGAGIYTIFWTVDWLTGSVFNLAGALLLAFPVMRRVWHTKNLTAAVFLILCFLGVWVYAYGKMRVDQRTNALMVEELFSTPEEKAQKADLIYEMASEGGFPYQCGKDVRMYDAYALFDRYTVERFNRYERVSSKRLGRQFGRAAMFAGGGEKLFSALPYFIVAYVAVGGALPVGSLLQYAGALGSLVGAVAGIASAFSELSQACRRQLSTMALLELQDEMYKGKLPVEKRSDYAYEIEFSHVWFQYPGAKDYALQDFSIKLKIGEKLAIVGPNGSGKTTMIKLLCRLYEPQRGEIRLNGVDIRKFRNDEYRKLFSVVFQDLYLFSLKLGENVAGAVSFDEERVKKCLADAGFGERLESLTEGLDTYLYKNYEDGGVEVSGGEAQKIAIARALYKDAPFILLDEPTAALDPKAEYEIYAGFDKMVGEKTAIYISHRLSSCRFCDDIAVFDGGRLVQRGSHEELVKDERGKYYELWSAQAQYYQ